MPKKEFEQNLDSKLITFRVKSGEKREIYQYAVNHGFDNISAFIKQTVFEEVRGIHEEKESKEEIYEELIKSTNERLEKQEILINTLLEVVSIDKKLKEDDPE